MNERLYRSRTDVIWTGVAGGVAEWFRMDPSLVRIAWVILTPLTGGLALLVYLVMWVVVPVHPYESDGPPPAGSTDAAAGAAGAADPAAGAAGTAAPAAGPGPRPAPEPAPRREPGNAGVIVGLGLILLGGLFLAREFFTLNWSYLWPAGLIAVGALLVIGAMRRRD